MNLLIVVRHGAYSGERLNEVGRSQIGALARKLHDLVPTSAVEILTSTAARARESAEIIGQVFGAGVQAHEVLWSENGRPEDLEAALQLVRRHADTAEVVLVVTHFEYAERFPEYFAQRELGVQLASGPIQKGEAWVIDCCQKTLLHIG